MRGGPRALLAGTAAAAAAALQEPAQAHLVSTQLGPLYDGAAHALASPEDLLSILAVALLAGLGGSKPGRFALIGLAGGWLAGAAAAFAIARGGAEVPLAAAATLLVLGVAAAADLRMRPAALGAAAAVIGLARGALNGAAAREAGGAWLSAIGTASGAAVAALLLLALAVWIGRHRARIALRVGGSWLAAIGLLMVGWALRG